ncbi:unnamed protein product [Dimorphilus gyrociliatus]|uniref:MYND-type domain-containing protein n=1 Tax=Dimorphilus gyrociliatus TaxID=2664684 RepID=A0A7I8W2R1_9ANNE|nr:unnamed protein product [Dimorphilus gyrociliatus]
MASAAEKHVDLGFAEKCPVNQEWKLVSPFFPSKLGGKPSWLALKGIPECKDILCEYCEEPCSFLLQLYAPIEDRDDCFHRTLFVFVCRNNECSRPNTNGNFVVLRCQLPQKNEFYSESPLVNEDEEDDFKFDLSSDYPKAENFQKLCSSCGVHGPLSCGICKKVSYCCKKHQLIHWKSGHKKECKQPETVANKVQIKDFHFPEFEIIHEKEDLTELESEDEADENDNDSKVEELNNSLKEKDLENFVSRTEDEAFSNFRNVIKLQPDQIIRYNLDGEPLWISSENKVSYKDISPCKCGTRRQFEFQIMPQLINYLEIDEKDDKGLDWGILAIYTCSKNCNSNIYNKEFIWRQDVSADK